jgi:hypothetical protein
VASARPNSFGIRLFLLALVGGQGDEAFVSPRYPPREIIGGKDHAPLTFHFGDQLRRPDMVFGSGGGDPIVEWA